LSEYARRRTPDLSFIAAPYYLGREEPRYVAGVHVLAAALAGGSAHRVAIEPEDVLETEISRTFDVIRALANAVRQTAASGALPVVLAVNCNSALGTVAGLDTPDDLGVVWFDAHGDLSTPENTGTGFIDGMGLAMLIGLGWQKLRSRVPGLRPVDPSNVVFIGGHDLNTHEAELLLTSGITHVRRGQPLGDALDRLAGRVRGIYLHVDLDVLDPSVGMANWVAADGGLSAGELVAAIETVVERLEIRALAFTAYFPECDPELRIPPVAKDVLERVRVRASTRC
jgi:arginase